ncbi:hypothetical protein WCLP8_3350001 [uncultured Gammaproteobacteria bacterium]
MVLDAGAWPLQPVFGWLKQIGAIECDELERTFNCGLGMVAVVARQRFDDADAARRGRNISVASPPWSPSCCCRHCRMWRCLVIRITSNCR